MVSIRAAAELLLLVTVFDRLVTLAFVVFSDPDVATYDELSAVTTVAIEELFVVTVP
jgi:hypothetical protein